MKKHKTIFWITTVLIFLAEGVMPALTVNNPMTIEAMNHLGYPDYFRYLLTAFKVLGALAILLPQVKGMAKEWAYAGFTFVFISAAVSNAAVDGIGLTTLLPLIALGILCLSYNSYHKLHRR